ncbi:MAG: murein biosynthesis integral membrane protein MurJ [Anaerolineaceae bacterium]|nr:murein biosynthesis integral membrane protein MurJ [Anaerolineaceae bacterium]
MPDIEGNKQPAANRQIARAASTVMIAMVIGQIASLVANSLIAGTFGTGSESEAYFAANRYSEIIFNLVAGGALGSAFIPTFAGLIAEEKRKRAWELASSIVNLLLVVLIFIAILSAIFAPFIVREILAPGFKGDPIKEPLTILLLRIQLPSAVIFGISGLAMGILNAHQRFLIPALAPAMYQLGKIFGTLVLAPFMGVQGLAVGVVLGAAFHLILQLPSILKLPERQYHLKLGLKIPDVHEVARLMAPRLLGVAAVQLNFWLNTNLATNQSEGSVTAINFAFPLMYMPLAAIAQSIAIAALPTFSAQAARNEFGEMRASLAATLRGVLLLAIPATIGLILLRKPIVALVYQRGAFTDHSTEMVSWALLWYASGLIGHSIVEILSRAFYALHDTKTPVFVLGFAMSLNLVFSLLFSNWFMRMGLPPHGALALANSLATTIEMGILLYLMRKRLKGLQGKDIIQVCLQAGIAALVMGAVIIAWLSFSVSFSAVWEALIGVCLGALAYGLMILIIKPRELDSVIGFVKNKISH